MKRVSESEPYTLMWIRNEFHNGYSGEKVIVFGHTETKTLHGSEDCGVYFGSNRIIGIDGGAVYGGQLNCLELPSKSICNKKLKEIRGILFLSIFIKLNLRQSFYNKTSKF